MIRCSHCKSTRHDVVDSRPDIESNIQRRRRKCRACKKRFTTVEFAEDDIPSLTRHPREGLYVARNMAERLIARIDTYIKDE